MRGLSLTEANAIIDGTFVEAAKRKLRPLSAIVLDAGGRVKAFQKQDGSSLLRFEIAYGKAFGSLTIGRPSRLVLQKAKDTLFMESVVNLADGPIFLEGGAQLIRDASSGEVIGAVGVTGDTNQMDDTCAIAGIHAAGLKTDEDFKDAEQVHALNIKNDDWRST